MPNYLTKEGIAELLSVPEAHIREVMKDLDCIIKKSKAGLKQVAGYNKMVNKSLKRAGARKQNELYEILEDFEQPKDELNEVLRKAQEARKFLQARLKRKVG